MRAYIIRRLLLMIPTLLLLTLLVFFVIRLVPGDVITAMLAVPGADAELDRDRIEHELGLDRPLIVQYGAWMGVVPQTDGSYRGIFQGDFQTSFWIRRPVVELMLERWPVTLQLGLMSLIVAQLIALPIGIFSALRQDKWGDYIGRSVAILFISVPGFWVATLVIVFPSIWWGYMPAITYIKFTDNPIGNLELMIIPAIVMGMAMGGLTMRMTRTMMLEVLRQDYIRTAWAKGLRERVIVIRHALKNALIPVITVVGFQVPVMIGGTVIIEKIFNLPGMGRLILDGILHRDDPLISGALLIFAVGLMLINLTVDLTYSYLDPRVRYE